jgi:hypothetical protein
LIDTLHGRAERDELVLRLLPLALVDEMLHLVELCRRQRYLVIAGLLLAEQH